MPPVRPVLTVEEDIHAMLVGERLHGCAHLLKLLVAGISGVPAPHYACHHMLAACKQSLSRPATTKHQAVPGA